jgi:hypothetical protein
MNMTLRRNEYLSDGIFGLLQSEDGQFQCHTIERSYLVNGNWMPKLAPGIYTCRRRDSPHFGYSVFQVMNVPDFQGVPVTYIEIHISNVEANVDGCIGVGETRGTLNGQDAVLQSGQAFHNFMAAQSGIDTFPLTVL